MTYDQSHHPWLVECSANFRRGEYAHVGGGREADVVD